MHAIVPVLARSRFLKNHALLCWAATSFSRMPLQAFLQTRLLGAEGFLAVRLGAAGWRR